MMKLHGRTRATLAALVACTVLIGTFALGAPARAAAGDQSISVSFSGGLSYSNTGTSTSGLVNVTRKGSTITGVIGSATIPGKNGGDATVSFNVSGLFGLPLYLGAINVSDPSANFSQSTFVLFGAVGSNGSGAQGATSWLLFKDLKFSSYRLSWSITDLAVQELGVRYRSFGNTGGNEIYVGTHDLGVAANRSEKGVTWAKPGSYDVTFTYDPQTLALTTDVSGGVGTLTRTLAAPPGNLDSLQIHVVDRDPAGQVDFLNATVDGTPLGSFIGNGDWQTFAFSSSSLNDGFTVTGTLVIDGTFGTSQELSKVEIGVGRELAG